MSDSLSCIQSLCLDAVKVYHVKDGQASVVTKGNLEVIYVPSFDRFLLQINDLKYALSTNIPVRCSAVEARAFRSYILPAQEGCYLIKLKATPCPTVLQNFETILDNYSIFSYQADQEAILKKQMKEDEVFTGILGAKVKIGDTYAKAGNYLRRGGDFIKQSLFKGASYVSKNVGKNYPEPDSNPNQLLTKTIDELRGLTATNNHTCYLPTSEIKNSIEISDSIQKDHYKPYAKLDKEEDVLLADKPVFANWNGIKRTACESASTIWDGMDETVSVISKALTFKKPRDTAPVNSPLYGQVSDTTAQSVDVNQMFDIEQQIKESPKKNALAKAAEVVNLSRFGQKAKNKEENATPESKSYSQDTKQQMFSDGSNVLRNINTNSPIKQSPETKADMSGNGIDENKYPSVSNPFSISQFRVNSVKHA